MRTRVRAVACAHTYVVSKVFFFGGRELMAFNFSDERNIQVLAEICNMMKR